jgi:hypothetical protein
MNTVSTLHPATPDTLSATKLKVTVVLKADELLGIAVRDSAPRVFLRVQLPDRTVTADIASKSLRKAQAAIRELGTDSVALILQGALAAGDKVVEAGLSAQAKAPRR